MYSLSRVLFFSAGIVLVASFSVLAQQPQDKQLSKDYMEQAILTLEATKAEDDARDQMVLAANYDTTNIKANFEAGHLHLITINKDLATKYFLRIYRQDPDYRFDLTYWIGKGYQLGLDDTSIHSRIYCEPEQTTVHTRFGGFHRVEQRAGRPCEHGCQRSNQSVSHRQ